MTREEEVMAFLNEPIFEPALNNPKSTQAIEAGINLTRSRMLQRRAYGMVHYFSSAVIGTERSTKFAEARQQGTESTRPSPSC